MSAVWRASRAAVKRRRLQTVIIGVVVLGSTATIVMALGLLVASSAPFDRAFNKQRGAHVVAVFDRGKVSDAQLAPTTHQPGVEAAAGPFDQAGFTVAVKRPGFQVGPLTVVGRADPGGPLDRLELWAGRWATGPGEIVMNRTPGGGLERGALGATIDVPGGPTLTVVGFAHSVNDSANAWVSPEQIAALHPNATQMLYRFTDSSTDQGIRSGLAAVTAGLPKGSLLASQSYLVLKQAFAAGPGAYVPYLMVFGILGLVVAVLIVANVVSGAVVSGFRHIGILKSLGFTPNQVVAVYLMMVSVPAVAGCVLGTAIGVALSQPLLSQALQGIGSTSTSVSPWVIAVALLGMPAIVVLAALVPALRAHRLSPAEAISAGSAPRAGRGLRVQRRLAGTRLPRSVSLGLGLPFARPGRTVLTMAAIILGVTTVTLATGLTNTMIAYGKAVERNGAVQVTVVVGGQKPGDVAPTLSDSATESLLRSLPGTAHVTADLQVIVHLAGYTQDVYADFLRGDSSTLNYQMVKGRWLNTPGEAVVPSRFMNQRGLAVGDTITLDRDGKQVHLTLVGETMSGDPNGLFADWGAMATLAPDQRPAQYQVQLKSGADVAAYVTAFQRQAGPGLDASANPDQTNAGTVTVVSSASLLTLMLAAVAALGVFNTVVLNTRERRRDLGMLKSIGMTPRQVTVMVVTSMAALGAVGGLIGIPIGVVAHRLVFPAMARPSGIDLPASFMNVWNLPVLALLALAGVAIAVLGSLIPARSAARLTVAKVLHNE